MQTVRIDVRRLAKALFFTLVLPVGLAIILDLSVGTIPLATIAASVVFIPLATIVVSRAALSEFDKVIQAVAPAVPDQAATPEQAAAKEARTGQTDQL